MRTTFLLQFFTLLVAVSAAIVNPLALEARSPKGGTTRGNSGGTHSSSSRCSSTTNSTSKLKARSGGLNVLLDRGWYFLAGHDCCHNRVLIAPGCRWSNRCECDLLWSPDDGRYNAEGATCCGRFTGYTLFQHVVRVFSSVIEMLPLNFWWAIMTGSIYALGANSLGQDLRPRWPEWNHLCELTDGFNLFYGYYVC